MESLIGTSPALSAVRDAIAQVAETDATVLILGETGSGKELVARSIHLQSLRRKRPFIPTSCVSLAPGLMASELFGHEVGAFTGANQRRAGRFEQAHTGTLFLDEIGELNGETQAMLLRVLQERVIERVGGNAVDVDVRIIAATNRNLISDVQGGAFRADLFYRLNVYPIAVPPLRERRSDIAPLAESFLKLFSTRHRRSVTRIKPATIRILESHNWPGNVRELQNVIERAVIVSRGTELTLDPAWLVGATVAETAKTWAAQERQRILDALNVTNGRIYGPGGAAHRLGLNPTTLYGKMKKHGIEKSSVDWK